MGIEVRTEPTRPAEGRVGVLRGTGLFVAAIVGPGILTLPALAAQRAGPASLIALAALLLVSAPIALTFVALHRAVPGAAGVAGYAAAAFGSLSGRLVSVWFRYGVPVGIPALGLIGGEYAAGAVGGGEATAVTVAVAICAAALASIVRTRAGSGLLTLVLPGLLVVLVLATAALSVPHADPAALTPFAPEGYAAVAASALVLTWVLTGWEAVTNLTGVMRDPRRTLPRVTVATLAVVALMYAAVALPELLVLGPYAGRTAAPVAEMLRVAVGPAGALVAALVAVVLAVGTVMAWVGSLAETGASAGSSRPDRARALARPSVVMAVSLAAAALTPLDTEALVSICAACQAPVYLLGLAAGVRLLPAGGPAWWQAVIGTLAVAALLLTAGAYLLAPVLVAVVVLGAEVVRRRTYRRRDRWDPSRGSEA